MKGLVFLLAAAALGVAQASEERRISVEDYRTKMEAAWLGQIVGVCWGAPIEFKFINKICPPECLGDWKEESINKVFWQDDLYVEMTFLKTLSDYGLDVSARQCGIDFANSTYLLWCANATGRTNLRLGIAPPDSSHPDFSSCANDIDYQIEADFSGILSPGMPQSVIDFGNKFGRMTNYGDGVYGGMFVGAMYSAAYFGKTPVEVVEKALACIPEGSDYARMVRDMLAWHRADPKNWEATWRKAVDRYFLDPELKDSNGKIDARINGALVVLGILYGDGDLEETIKISARGGFDADCNPSSAGGVVFTLCPERITGKFRDRFDRKHVFSHTQYCFDDLLAVSEKLTRQLVVRYGGRVEKDADGREWLVIPDRKPVCNELEQSWNSRPRANVRYTAEERAKIKHSIPFVDTEQMMTDADPTVRAQKALDLVAPGWKTTRNGGTKDDQARMNRSRWSVKNEAGRWVPVAGYRAGSNCDGEAYRCAVLVPDESGRVAVSSKVSVPSERPELVMRLKSEEVNGPHPFGSDDSETRLVVSVNGRQAKEYKIGKCREGWTPLTLDLTPWAGQTVDVELEASPTKKGLGVLFFRDVTASVKPDS